MGDLPGWLPADLAVPESAGVACLACRLPPLPLAYFAAPLPRRGRISPRPLPGGKGEIFSFLMQGASPLASPGLNPGGTGAGARITRWRVACPAGCLLPPLPLAYFISPIPPTPFPAGRGRLKVYFAGGFAPGTPALNRLRHLQTLPSRHRRGDLFSASPVRCKTDRTAFLLAVPAAKERGDRGRGTSAFEMVLSPGAG